MIVSCCNEQEDKLINTCTFREQSTFWSPVYWFICPLWSTFKHYLLHAVLLNQNMGLVLIQRADCLTQDHKIHCCMCQRGIGTQADWAFIGSIVIHCQFTKGDAEVPILGAARIAHTTLIACSFHYSTISKVHVNNFYLEKEEGKSI